MRYVRYNFFFKSSLILIILSCSKNHTKLSIDARKYLHFALESLKSAYTNCPFWRYFADTRTINPPLGNPLYRILDFNENIHPQSFAMVEPSTTTTKAYELCVCKFDQDDDLTVSYNYFGYLHHVLILSSIWRYPSPCGRAINSHTRI